MLSIPLFLAGPLSAAQDGTCALLRIDRIGWQQLESAKSTAGVSWWVELGDRLLTCGTVEALSSLESRFEIETLATPLALDQLRLAGGFHQTELDRLDAEVIARSSGWALVYLDPSRLEQVDSEGLVDGRRRVLRAVEPDTVLLRQQANSPPRPTEVFDLGVQDLVDLVNGDRWFADIVLLASFNRYTHNAGIHEARDWLVSEFSSLPGLLVTTPSFLVGGTLAFNVVATLTGSERPDDWYVIGGHYDATSEIPQQEAPGAEDNASGCAGVLELARAFTTHPPDATVLFICYSGEEQGLYGSQDHVDDLIASGDLPKVKAMLDLDMIGFTSDGDLDCLLETEPFAQPLIDLFTDAALAFTTLRIETSYNPCCSDHWPYLEVNVPALLTIENDWWQYPYYHTSNDLPQHLTVAMGEEILKMNVAAMAQLIGSPPALLFLDGFESGDTSAWTGVVP